MLKLRHISCTLAVMALVTIIPAHAGIVLTAAQGATVYGATNYCCVNNGGPTYILNNVTGNADILTSPGNGYQTANPVVGNNVAQSGIVSAPYSFGWSGGVSGVSGTPFGQGLTTDNGPNVGWYLSDTTVGCCSASYMITSVLDSFQVQGAAFTGNLGGYLAISGTNLTGSDSSVASAILSYNINNAGFIQLPQMVLAASGNCVTSVALGGTGASLRNTACTNGGNGGSFRGLALDLLPVNNLAIGSTIVVQGTITAYADPASGSILDSYIPDQTLINDVGGTLPDFNLLDSGVQNPAPEPATIGLLGGALVVLAMVRRRRR